MPRGRKKTPKVGRRGAAVRGGADSGHPTDEEYDTADNLSVVSSTSDKDSVIAEGLDDDAGGAETNAQEVFEEKLKECIEELTQKSAKGRVEALHRLRRGMCQKYIYDFLTDRKVTIADGLEKCLKKGKGDEQSEAAMCAAILLLQLGVGAEADEIYGELQPVLQVVLADNAAALKGRSGCAEALGMCTFLASGDKEHVQTVMKTLENIFKKSYLKGDGNAPSHSPEVAALHTSALSAWTLLLSIAPASVVEDLVDSHLPKLPQLLTSADVELRIAAGEAIALLYELAREEDEMFDGENIDSLCDTLKQLATDSNKYRAKKDRRQQRSSFRDVLRTVQEGEAPSYQVKFGIESVRIDSWARKTQYDALCHMLGSGMNVHLQENELVREIFGLGSPLPTDAVKPRKGSKAERHMFNAAAFKARTKVRSKNRDKRAVTMHSD